MKITLRGFLFVFLFTTINSTLSLAYEFNVFPPDSTTGVIDKTASLLLVEKGKTLYFEGKYRDALTRFREAVVKDPYSSKANYWIAECQYDQDNYGLALKYALKAKELQQDEVDKDVYELLGRTYHRTGELDSALANYTIAKEKLSAVRARDLGVDLHLEQVKFAIAEKSKGIESKLIPLSSINSGYNDYAPVLTEGGKTIYFTSRRSDTKGGTMNPDDQVFFEDIYRAVWNETEQIWDSISNDLGRLNTTGFDAISYLAPNGMSGLITINTTAVKEKISTKSSDIFEVEKSNQNKWNTPKRINNNSINTSYFDGAATITADGSTMYFVSDRNGEKKALDIYVVQKNGKSWGEAKPLPDNINSKGRETTPYITPDGRYLFFSSDGMANGMGGYDIYVSENLGDSWSDPVNLGSAFNTVNNDTHFQYYPGLNLAVMATLQIIGQKASIDIYQMDMTGFTVPTLKK